MAYKTIVFDFDGTLADTVDTFIQIINDLSDEFNYHKATPEQVKEYRGKTARELIKIYGISKLRLIGFIKRVKLEFSRHMYTIEPCDGMLEIIRELHGKGYQLGILSSNSKGNIMYFCDKYRITEYFDFFATDAGMISKTRAMRKTLKKHNLPHESTIYIGDELKDIHAAHHNHIPVIAVTWGVNTQEALKAAKPTWIAEEGGEILTHIK